MSGNENTHGAGPGDGHGNGPADGHVDAAWAWQPVPHGGEYESDATAFVKLPPDMFGGTGTGEPLAAPGHGYVPPVIVPVTSAASTDPASTGTWTLPVGEPVQWPAAAVAEPPAGGGTDPGATAEWHFGEASAQDHSLTGEWSVPVADGDLPEESGEYARTSLSPEWARQAPATLPGGAPAPWAAALAAEAAADAARDAGAAGLPGQAHPDAFGADAYAAAEPVADGEDAYGHPATPEFDGVRGYVAPPADYTGTAVRIPAEAGGHPAADTYLTGTFAGLADAALGADPGAGNPGVGHAPAGEHPRTGYDTAAGHPAQAPHAASQAAASEAHFGDAARPAVGDHPVESHPGAGAYPAEGHPGEDGYPAAAAYSAPGSYAAPAAYPADAGRPVADAYPGEPFAAPEPAGAGQDPYAAQAPEAGRSEGTPYPPRHEHEHEHEPAHVPLPAAGTGTETYPDTQTYQDTETADPAGATATADPDDPADGRAEPVGEAAPAEQRALPQTGGERAADPSGDLPVDRSGERRGDVPAVEPEPVADADSAVEAEAGTETAAAAGPAPVVAREADAAGEPVADPAAAEADAAADSADAAGEAPEAALAETEAAADGHGEHPYASYVLRVNGADRPVTAAWIGESLLYVLRERLGLAGAKDGCSQGECGACAVQVDGRLVASCLVPAATAAGSEVRTVEGLATEGELSDVQRALCGSGAVQCGFCVPGMAMTIHDLLEGNHAPSELETRQALCGNLCRCSGYRGVLEAVREVVAGREAAHAAEHPEAEAGAASESAFGVAEYAPEARIPHQAPPGAGGVHHEHGHEHEHDHGGMGGMA